MSKLHVKRVWGPQNSLRIGFTFPMDANTSKIPLQLFDGIEANSRIRQKGLVRIVF